MNPLEYYQNQLLHQKKQLTTFRNHRNLVTMAKLICFGLLVYLIYQLIADTTFPISYLILGDVFVFTLLTIVDNRLVFKYNKTKEIIYIITVETNYLKGELSPLSTGEEYQNPTHAYAGDLDLFGEDSVFQHLNRTVTAEGKQQLTDWLLNLSKDQQTIIQRQQATKELIGLTEWCHQFRALGKLYPTALINQHIFYKWQSQKSFFPKPHRTKTYLYIANSIVIGAWSLAIPAVIPPAIPICLSLLQLLILALFLRKINLYHQQLGLFLRTISHYLPLTKHISGQIFQSPYLLKLQNTLSNNNHNALKAFSQLNKIQEKLDQRGNVLLSFILNGLYLKDFHSILSLDHWKNTYSHCVTPWIKAISQTDALISMANYRFNHPTYSVPEFSKTALLDTIEIGHPLLKNKQCVTNNFKIETLHQLFIVTGANMAGKSTFLRTIGVNLILAQSGNVVCSARFAFQPMALFTSMRTTDNLSKDTSYFHAELLRLKQLIATAEHEERLFIILDEMLKGTNSIDKLNGSRAFLQKLLSNPVLGLIATHDLALGELSHSQPDHFSNVCFEITHTEDSITYDYKLHPGISSTMNATILLKQMGLI